MGLSSISHIRDNPAEWNTDSDAVVEKAGNGVTIEKGNRGEVHGSGVHSWSSWW